MWKDAIYLRGKSRRPVRLTPYKAGKDMQDQVPSGWCNLCGREVYEWGSDICTECKRWNGYAASKQERVAASVPGLLSGERSGSL